MAFRKSRSWGNVKPGEGAAVDWGDPINNGLYCSYILNENAGKTARNIARHDNATIGADSNYTPGKFGPSLYCRGGAYDTEVSFPMPIIGTADDFTISFWCIATSWPGAYTALMDDGVSSSTRKLTQWINTSGDGNSFGGTCIATSGTASGMVGLTAGKWWHCAYSRRGGTISVYRNGVLLASAANSAASLGNPMVFGNKPSGGGGVRFIGAYSHISFWWKRGLNSRDIHRLYAEPFAGISTPLLRLNRSAAAPPAASTAPQLTLLGVG